MRPSHMKVPQPGLRESGGRSQRKDVEQVGPRDRMQEEELAAELESFSPLVRSLEWTGDWVIVQRTVVGKPGDNTQAVGSV
jgi:hypothetical protein